jgi:hypothetical protein
MSTKTIVWFSLQTYFLQKISKRYNQACLQSPQDYISVKTLCTDILINVHVASHHRLHIIHVYISQLIQYARACSSYDQSLNRGRLLTHELIDWLIIYGFTHRSRIFHLYGDVTIAGEGLQNLGLCSAPRAFELGRIFNVPQLLWHGPRFFRSHPKNHPIQ